MDSNNFLNCWEYNKCDREPGGENVLKYGVCSVTLERGADSIHNGKNGGRCCWVITNPVFEEDSLNRDCRECDFYLFVKKSEKLLFVA